MEERLLMEFSDLTQKIAKLEQFTLTEKSDALDNPMRDLMMKQLEVMRTYNDILFERISRIMRQEKD